MSDQEKVIAKIGNDKNCILFKLSTYRGRPVIDIRRHYFDKSSGKLSPTRKGITLSEKNYRAVHEIFLENEAMIRNWFQGNMTTEEVVDNNVKEEDKATQEAKYGFKIYERDTKRAPISSFFHIESNGGKEKVCYNSDHPFFSIIQSSLESIKKNLELSSEIGKDIEAILFLVDAVLLSYFRSKSLLENTNNPDSETLFETLEMNWSATLKRYIKELKYMLL